jgi:hypothetical protein
LNFSGKVWPLALVAFADGKNHWNAIEEIDSDESMNKIQRWLLAFPFGDMNSISLL